MNLRRMTRRRFTKTLASLGFGITSALHLTTQDVQATDNEKIPIVTQFKPEENEDGKLELKPVKEEVPVDWYSDLRTVKHVHEHHDFSRYPGVIGSTIVSGDYYGERPYIRLELSQGQAERDETTLNEAQDQIPDDLQEVRIETLEIGDWELGDCYESYDSEVPPGSKCKPDSDTYGSLGPRLYDSGEYFFSTCEHLGDGLAEGDTLHGYSTSVTLGEVVTSDCYDDVAVVKPTGGYNPDNITPDTETEVSGYLSESGISSIAASDNLVDKNGVRTCHTWGSVDGVGTIYYVYQGCSSRDNQVKWGQGGDEDSDFYSRDSGSICYYIDEPREGRAVCTNAGWAPQRSGNPVYGTAAYHVYDKYGFYPA